MGLTGPTTAGPTRAQGASRRLETAGVFLGFLVFFIPFFWITDPNVQIETSNGTTVFSISRSVTILWAVALIIATLLLAGAILVIWCKVNWSRLRAFCLGLGPTLAVAIVMIFLEFSKLQHSYVIITDRDFSAVPSGMFKRDPVTVPFDRIGSVHEYSSGSRRRGRRPPHYVAVRLVGGGEMHFDFGKVHYQAWTYMSCIDREIQARRQDEQFKSEYKHVYELLEETRRLLKERRTQEGVSPDQ